MLQQMVFDFCDGFYVKDVYCNRSKMFDAILRLHPKNILETGCIANFEDWKAGYSTYLFDMAGATVTSVDPSEEKLKLAQNLVPRMQGVCSDSVRFLQRNRQQYDVIYLDYINDPNYCMEEVKNCHGDIIAIDDTFWDGGWAGRGQIAVPYLLNHGYRVEAAGYGVVLVKGDRQVGG